jgi:oligoribonuclease
MSHRIQRQQDPGNLVWIDLEMTGLDPQTDVILQAALIVTNRELEPLEEYVTDVWQPAASLEHMVPFVRQMHERTGLLARVPASTTDLAQAERELLERVAGWCPYRPVLCGNSIASDRKFLDRYMPALTGYLHYRMVDVSTLKVLAQLWHGPSALYQKPKSGEHDALFDIRESIAELRHYRRALLAPTGAD